MGVRLERTNVIIDWRGLPLAFSAPWLVTLGAVLFGTLRWDFHLAVLLPLVLATAAHEGGHVVAAGWLGIPLRRVEIGLLEGRVWLVDRPPARLYARVLVAGPLAHGLAGLATAAIGLWGGRSWVGIGALITLHALSNLAPRLLADGTLNDGGQLAELWLAGRDPRWRGVLVLAISASLIGMAGLAALSDEASAWIPAGLALCGVIGAVGGIDLLRRR